MVVLVLGDSIYLVLSTHVDLLYLCTSLWKIRDDASRVFVINHDLQLHYRLQQRNSAGLHQLNVIGHYVNTYRSHSVVIRLSIV